MNRLTKIKFSLLHRIAPFIKDDASFLKLKWRLIMGTHLNLKNPKTFNEKLQWLKLHDHNPEYTRMVDKYEAKNYVAETIGEQYVIPTIAVYDRVEDIDFASLPDQFVLKCTHDSGGVVICKEKSKFDTERAKAILRRGLQTNFYFQTREWPYKNVKPRIIAEQYMASDDGEGLTDYKFHNFNGIPKVILVCRDRFKANGLTEDFYTAEWQHIELKRPDLNNAIEEEPRPAKLDEMLRLSAALAQNTSFVRTDFYYIDDKIYFGEITFFPASGIKPFEPAVWDEKFGEWLKLPVNNEK